MKTYHVAADITFEVPGGVQYKSPQMSDWAEALAGMLSVHQGDQLQASSSEAVAAIDAALGSASSAAAASPSSESVSTM